MFGKKCQRNASYGKALEDNEYIGYACYGFIYKGKE
jgi:hypothetical protein